MKIFASDALLGKTFLVTGASSGLGRATSILIAACGGQVLASGRDSSQLAASINLMQGDKHIALPFTLSTADSLADWIKSVTLEYGALSGIFHSAGTALIRPARMTQQYHLEELMQSSLYSAFGIARAAASKGIIIDGGSIVMMSSVAGARGQSGMTAYSAVKAGIDGLVRSLACELAPRKIRVNSIAAGAVETEMHTKLTTNIAGTPMLDKYEQDHLLGFGQPEDIANAALFLLSDAAKWVTGTNLIIDGGYMA